MREALVMSNDNLNRNVRAFALIDSNIADGMKDKESQGDEKEKKDITKESGLAAKMSIELTTDSRNASQIKQVMASAGTVQIGKNHATDDGTGDDSKGPEDSTATPSKAEVTQVSGVQASKDAQCAVTPVASTEVARVSTESDAPSGLDGSEQSETSEIQGLIPKAEDRPAFRVFDKNLKHNGQEFKPGVWYFDRDKDGILTHTWVCSPLHIDAVTFDGQQRNFGRMLRLRNTLGNWRVWAMPMEMLRGAADDLRGELLAMGVEIDPGQRSRRLLSTYLQSEPPKRTMRCALQVGWCEGSFILPDAVIGPKASEIIFQSGECGHDEHTTAGTLEGWRQEISSRAVGNPLLLMALSASFAGPLLALCNLEGGGLHFVGDSSTGKTTLLEAACSVWGGPNYRRSWRATANGMEGAAALFNDCLLALDEISECNPHEVGAVTYALSNGRGKQRAGRAGNARAVTRWRCFVLSSGERTIETTMREVGQRTKAGQAVRLLDMSASRKYGAWDKLHQSKNGTAFSDAIKQAVIMHHGRAGRAFLEKLTRDERKMSDMFERLKALNLFAAKGSEGQEKRAGARFALMALAGELATEYGITGWPQGTATKAAAECFKAWRASRGNGNDEGRQILAQVMAFIERHGDSRFSKVDDYDASVRDRAGWWENAPDGSIYYFTGDGLREALKGHDFGRGLDALEKVSALPSPDVEGKRSRVKSINGRSKRVYPLQSWRLGDCHVA
jgi:putative DNA primase/helicase